MTAGSGKTIRRGEGLIILCLLGMAAATARSAEPASERFEFSQTEMAIPIRIVLYAGGQCNRRQGRRGRLFPLPPTQRRL